MAHPSSFRQLSARVAVGVIALVVADCAGTIAGRATPPDDGAYLVFRTDKEDEVRVAVAAVPVGGRGLTRFDWTLSGHTLSTTPRSRPRR